ncbi:MAG: IgGFc-binding protein [Myxococcota bacterium]
MYSTRLALVTVVVAGLGSAACSSPGGGGPAGPGPTTPISDEGGFVVPDVDAGSGGEEDGATGPGPDGQSPGSDVDNGLTPCDGDGDCEAPTPYCGVTGFCFECLEGGHCADDESCTNGSCVSSTCTPGDTQCDGRTRLTCAEDGTSWEPFFCVGGDCVGGECQGCEPGKRVCKGDREVMVCDAEGETYEAGEPCTGEDVCVQGRCVECFPGNRRCTGQVAEVCSLEGAWEVAEDCAVSGQACSAGACLSPCSADLKAKSNTGCDYWAVDLDNHYAAQEGPFAVIVSNLSDNPSTVTITVRDGPDMSPEQVAEETVAPGELEILQLPQRHPAGAGIGYGAFRIQSTSPIIAYQFNPLDNVDVFSNDASLLIPAHTYGTEYLAVSRAQFVGGGPEPGPQETCETVCQGEGMDGAHCEDDGSGTGSRVCVLPYRGTVTVVAPEPDTQVTIEPTARTLTGDGLEVMQPGQAYTYTLGPYQVLNVKSDEEGGDLTGTVVTADGPVAVFSGHEASVSSDRCCADHLEQQMFPVNTWGTRFLASKSHPRGVESDYWRILASEDGTQVTFSPEVAPPQTLDRGEFYELSSKEDFEVQSDEPVTLVQVLASSGEVLVTEVLGSCAVDQDCHPGYSCELLSNGQEGCVPPTCAVEGTPQGCPNGHTCACFDVDQCYCQAIGDPALVTMAPVGQFRKSYVFLSPNKYQNDYVNVLAPTEATVTFDGVDLPSGNFQAIPDSGYKVARLEVTDGIHRIQATHPVGVVAYGYDRDVSYGYTAGLNLTDL